MRHPLYHNRHLSYWFVLTILTSLLDVNPLSGQPLELPPSQLFAVELEPEGDTATILQVQHLTADHPQGYNNQPWFISPTQLVYSSNRLDTAQTDLWLLDLTKKQRRRLTQTASLEFSPRLRPGGQQLTYVRMDVDPDQTQQLMAIDWPQGSTPHPIPPDIRGTGYFAWLTPESHVQFVVEDPHQLLLVQEDREPRTFASRIGRCLARRSDNEVLFVQKVTDQDWYIKRYNLLTQRSEILVKTRPGVEDFLLLADGRLLCGDGSQLYVFQPKQDFTWQPWIDLQPWGISNISRLATNGSGTFVLVNLLP